MVIGGVAEDADPAWSPDGKHIVFQTRWTVKGGILMFDEKEGAKTIFRLEAAAGVHHDDVVALSTSKGANRGTSNEMQTSWSPDSGKIVFVSDRSGNLDIWILNFKGFAVSTGAY